VSIPFAIAIAIQHKITKERYAMDTLIASEINPAILLFFPSLTKLNNHIVTEV
jgi:hypothetical protein